MVNHWPVLFKSVHTIYTLLFLSVLVNRTFLCDNQQILVCKAYLHFKDSVGSI